MLKWRLFVEREGNAENFNVGYFRNPVINQSLHFGTLVGPYLK